MKNISFYNIGCFFGIVAGGFPLIVGSILTIVLLGRIFEQMQFANSFFTNIEMALKIDYFYSILCMGFPALVLNGVVLIYISMKLLKNKSFYLWLFPILGNIFVVVGDLVGTQMYGSFPVIPIFPFTLLMLFAGFTYLEIYRYHRENKESSVKLFSKVFFSVNNLDVIFICLSALLSIFVGIYFLTTLLMVHFLEGQSIGLPLPAFVQETLYYLRSVQVKGGVPYNIYFFFNHVSWVNIIANGFCLFYLAVAHYKKIINIFGIGALLFFYFVCLFELLSLQLNESFSYYIYLKQGFLLSGLILLFIKQRSMKRDINQFDISANSL